MKAYNMKPLFSLIMLAVPWLMVNSQHLPDSAHVIVDIMIPDSGFMTICGRNSSPSASADKYGPYMLDPQVFDNQGDMLKKKGLPVFYEKKRTGKTAYAMQPEKRFYAFLEESQDELKIENPSEDFRITRISTDDHGYTHIRALMQFKGIEVYGSESVFHIDNKKERFTAPAFRMNGSPDTVAVIMSERAIEIAIQDVKSHTQFRELNEKEKTFLKYTSPACKRIIYPLETGPVLAWEIYIRTSLIEEWKYFVNAVDGSIIRYYNNTKSDGPALGTGDDLNGLTRTFNVYLKGGIYYMYDITRRMYNPVSNEGIIITLDGNNTSTSFLDYTYVTSVDNSWTQTAAISAHCNATRVYEYFDTTFNRNSINGKGGDIISLVNITLDDGSSMENAFWNGQAIFYGNGGPHVKSLAGSIDVTAHEMSHGIISSTANLEYDGQPGAISESFADIFACMIDRTNWTIGEDIAREEYYPSGVLRDLSDPHNTGDTSDIYWQPAHLSEMYMGENDNGGIHLNSGICNYAFYLFASRIGKPKAEQVYYRALTEYLTITSGFIELRIAVEQSARDLFGDGSFEMNAASAAFEKVGIHREEPVEIVSEFHVNPGEEFLLSNDTNPSDPASLYLSSSRGTNYRSLTNTPMRGKASVTDDGKKGIFVSSDRRIRMINTDSSVTGEKIISGFGNYDNVAISKNGKRIATNKIYADGSIYVVDLERGRGVHFILYNPTTGNMRDEGGVLKAYSMEWDITGEYLIYDAYNILNSNSLKDIYYWDIGFIKVWDNKTNDFADGTITKLFSSLPANVNVVNPVFSKNSPHIIAYDYFYDDGVIEEYSIFGANLVTGDNKKIISNDRLGYPSYSGHDDQIAYSTINGSNMQVVKSIKLYPDKITPRGEPGVLVPDAKWPVFFSTGIRPLGLPPASNFTADYKSGNNELTVRFLDISQNKPFTWHWFFQGGYPAESTEQNPEIFYASPGRYKVVLVTVNAFGSDTLTRENYIHVVNPTASGFPEKDGVLLFPNPVYDMLTIQCNEVFEATIFNTAGNVVMGQINQPELDLSRLKSGLYIIEIAAGKNIYRQKLIKR